MSKSEQSYRFLFAQIVAGAALQIVAISVGAVYIFPASGVALTILGGAMGFGLSVVLIAVLSGLIALIPAAD